MAGLTDKKISNNNDEIESSDVIVPKKYVAVRGYTKTTGKKKVRVRPYVRKTR